MAGINFVLIIRALLDDAEMQNLRLQRRHLRDTSDPLSMPEETFRGIFRLSKQAATDLILELAPHLREQVREAISIPKKLKILMALCFFGQGSYQKSCGQDMNMPMSQASVSRCIREVSFAMNEHMAHYVQFPLTDEAKANEKAAFMEKLHGFPGIVGAIDCTHISIKSPKIEEVDAPAILFYNRKGYYSLNVQIIVNANLKLLAINARYPGSVHDSAIWSTSQIHQHLFNNYRNGDRSTWLLGDSGYPLQPWLMTPIGNPTTPSERAYNIAHKSLRCVVERFNGVFKGIFRDTNKERTLHYDPITAGKIINACAIMYNFRLEHGEIQDYPEINEAGDPQEPIDALDNQNYFNEGRNTRNRIIREYF